ncbi:protein spindle-F [Aethina tumida]|uniref:protein spindle-F n=1 Tax=Aethina tumida TaxID=116153 RepID=UPI00096B1285|nr:protein spindle-F [Aethina tumida]
MEESVAAQYAVQIAVQTLKDRCRTLQQRVAELEEENVNLRMSCVQREQDSLSLTEIDRLRQHVAEVSEQKSQLQNTVEMVTNENKELWRKLLKLMKTNRNLGSQLHQISDTLTNHNSTLQRSKTFTQTEPHVKVLQKKLEENDQISSELENISLKLIDSFSKEKQEFEALCTEIKDLHATDNIAAENFAFCYEDDLDSDTFNDLYGVLEELRLLKEETMLQQNVLKACLKKMKEYEQNHQKIQSVDKETLTDESLLSSTQEVEPLQQNSDPPSDRVCPMCCKVYYKNTSFEDFQQHVQDHFQEGFEML